MLKGISYLLGPDLLSILYRMGHGDEIVFADAHFPAESLNNRIVRADGIKISDLLEAVMPLFVLDEYDEHPILMMAPVEGDQLDPLVEKSYSESINKYCSQALKIHRLERFDFYKRATNAFAVVVTGEIRKYGNIILKKGVIPIT